MTYDPNEPTTERAAIREFSGGQVRETAEDIAAREHPCLCGGTLFWVSKHGPIICGSCHPPADPKLVVRWIGDRGSVCKS